EFLGVLYSLILCPKAKKACLGNVNTTRFKGYLDDETEQGYSAEGLYTDWNDDTALSTDRYDEGTHFMANP
ncbi:MAG: hypothetical protein ABGX72_10555, partial [Methyloprofundus sp.]